VIRATQILHAASFKQRRRGNFHHSYCAGAQRSRTRSRIFTRVAKLGVERLLPKLNTSNVGTDTMQKRAILAASAGLVALALAAPPVEAADRFGVTCVFNRTNIPLNYARRWGNDQWRRISIPPGGFWVHRWEYTRGQEGFHPPLSVVFDDDLSAQHKNRYYHLLAYRSPDIDPNCARGKRYFFQRDGRGYIDMFSVN
jgi:hypothetical protein